MPRARTHPPAAAGTSAKQPFDIDEAFRRLRRATATLPKAAMFELRDEGYSSPFELLVAALDHEPTAIAVIAERACLAVLDGSCRTPIAAYAEIAGTALKLRALIALPDGSAAHRAAGDGIATRAGAAALGRAVGERLKALAGPGFTVRCAGWPECTPMPSSRKASAMVCWCMDFNMRLSPPPLDNRRDGIG